MTEKITKQTTAINLAYTFIDLVSRDSKTITQNHLQYFIYFVFKYNAQYSHDNLFDSSILVYNNEPLNITIKEEFSVYKSQNIHIDSDTLKEKIIPMEFHQSLIADYIWAKFYKMDISKIATIIINENIFKKQHGTKIDKDNIKSSFNDDSFLPYMNFLMPRYKT